MTRLALVGLLSLSIAACASRSEQRLQKLYDSSAAQLWRGELANASSGAKEGLTLAGPERASVWAWRFNHLPLQETDSFCP